MVSNIKDIENVWSFLYISSEFFFLYLYLKETAFYRNVLISSSQYLSSHLTTLSNS